MPSLKDTAPSPLLMCSNRFAAKGRGRRNQTAEHNVIFFCPFASCLCPPTLHILLPSLHILLRAFVTQSLTFPTSYRAKQTAEGARPGGCSQSRSSDQGPLPNLHLPKPQTSNLNPHSSILEPYIRQSGDQGQPPRAARRPLLRRIPGGLHVDD